METTKPSQAGIAIKWALINIVAAIIITFATQFMGVDALGPAKYLGDIPFIVFLCLAQMEYRKQLSGFMTYGEGFVEGLLYAVFCGILTAIFMYVYIGILYPEIWTKSVDAQEAKLVQQGLSSDQVDTTIGMMRKYGTLFVVVGSLFGVPIIGIIISLITAAIFKKERTLADIENQANDPAV